MDFDFDEESAQFSPPLSPAKRSDQDEEEQINARRFMDKFNNDRANHLLESNRTQESFQ